MRVFEPGEFGGMAERIMEPPPPPPAPSPEIRARKLKKLLARINELESEAVRLAVPLPHVADFFGCRKLIRILDGANQSGKTFTAMTELARALLGRDPFGKYPKKDGRALFVGYDGDHLADPIRKKLFEPGEFKLIPDERTGRLRAVRVDPDDPRRLDPYDEAYREKWRDAPPLIPPRMIREWAWDDKAKQIPRLTTLVNGWRILWRTSGGRPPRGIQIHLVFVDEDLQYPALWVPELLPRLIKHKGRFIWSATPQEGGPELYELRLKADAQSPHVAAFTMLVDDNPYIAEAEKEFLRTTLSEDELAVRYHGQYAIVGRRVYPHYDPMGPHGCEPFPVPASWCRYLVLDPGTQYLATLFGAVDPEEKHATIYDALLLRNADVFTWAAEVKKREEGVRFEALVIDQQAGRQRGMANTGPTFARQYFQALAAIGVLPRTQGPLDGFMAGSNDVLSRQNALSAWMAVRGTGPFKGTPYLQVMRGISAKLDTQIRLAQSDEKNPEKRMKMRDDLLQCLEYFAAYGPGYFKPVPTGEEARPKRLTVYEEFQQKQQQRRRHRRPHAVGFGAGLEIG